LGGTFSLLPCLLRHLFPTFFSPSAFQKKKMGYLTPRALRGLKQYKYKAGGYTWLDDAHQPFWNGEMEDR